MRNLALGIVLMGLLAACGGDDGLGDGEDGGILPDSEVFGCNAVAQTGCAAGEKCTWINVDSANDVGTLGCVAEGDVALGDACTYGPDGETTGYDNCIAGAICIFSQCEEICTDSPDSCGNTSACSSYSGLFPDTSGIGACDFLCDPVSQIRTFDNAATCGQGADGIMRACYANPDDTFSCTGVPGPAANLKQDATAYGPASGGAYVNGCAAGFAPLLRKANDATAPVGCFAFCRPADMFIGQPAGNLDGLPASGFQCADRVPATPGLECRYYWFTMATPAVDQNNVGFCFDPTHYVGDLDDDPNTADTAFPSCASLNNTDGDGNGQSDALDWACVAVPAAATGGPVHHHPSPLVAPSDDMQLRR